MFKLKASCFQSFHCLTAYSLKSVVLYQFNDTELSYNMAVVEIALNSYPPSTAVQDCPFQAITSSPPLSSPTRPSPVAEPMMHVYELSDFKDFTYRELVSNTGLLLGAIQEGDQLQTSLQAVLQGRNIAQDIRSILNYCKKAGGLLGHRRDCITIPVDNVLSKLNKQSIPQRVKEIQALQLICEALLEFPQDLIFKMTSLTSEQRHKLLRQFQSTPLGTNVHSFCEKGAWSDPALQPILQHAGYKLVNSRLQFHQANKSRDLVKSATMSVLAVEVIYNEEKIFVKK